MTAQNIIRPAFALLTLSALLFACRSHSEEKEIIAATPEQTSDISYMEEMLEKPIPPNPDIPKGARCHDRIPFNAIGNYAELFNDSNKYQYAYAERFGIKPITSLNDAYNANQPLQRIQTCQYYVVDPLTHSMPYLTYDAATLLKLIGRNFIDSLNKRGADGYKIIVTSLLRTPATVKRLRRVNRNASDSSCHKFATTFDISYARFAAADSNRTIDEYDLRGVLAEVIWDLRKKELCMVKYERRSPCFHITVTPGARKR